MIEFAAGFVSGPLYFAIATAILLSTLYVGAAISARIQARRRPHPSPEPGEGLMAVSLLLGFLLTAVWATPVVWAVLQIPIVGEQLERMTPED